MRIQMSVSGRSFLIATWCLTMMFCSHVGAQSLIPGTGTPLTKVGDDFEDPNWQYDYRLPKVYTTVG